MRRIISLVLAMAITLSIALFGGFSVSAESNLAASDECIDILKKYEGFSPKPYYDYGQWTIGYGTRCPTDKLEYYRANGISEAEAVELLRKYVSGYSNEVNGFADKYSLTMTQGQFDALVLFSFNCGSSWMYSPGQNFHQTIAKGNDADPKEVIYWFASWSNAGGRPLTALINRRLCEANMYLNGAYTTAIPDNYNYVIYDATGGSVPSRIHAYDTTATPVTPTYPGYEFVGWFTEKNGGTQVTSLDESADGISLYARWEGDGVVNGGNSDITQTIDPVKITVTSNYVNLRKGPGTNYATVGQANTGDQFTITEIATGSGHTWGNFSTGWISLTFTNYEDVKDNPSVEEPTEPEPTQPEPTEPEPTEPEPTQPEPTEPEPTEPEPTQPEPTEPEEPQGVTGKVKANGGLTVRSGPGTGYSSVGVLNNGDAVTILEQKSVGSMIWGKIANGWISMSYVVLDKTEEVKPEEPKPEAPTPEEPGSETDSVTGYVKANGGLNIRGGAGTNYPIVGTYNNGDKVTVTQKQTVGSVTWGKTEKGWISLNYFTTEAPSDPGGTQPAVETGTVQVDDVLRIRSGPGTSYAISGYYNGGDRVTITQKQTVNGTTWGKTDKGWISLDYVKLDAAQGGESEDTDADIRTVTASCLNVRSAAGTGNSIVGYLNYGAKVQILEQTTVDGVLWGKISTGWICLQYTK